MQQQTPVDDPKLQRLYEEPHTTRERHLGLMSRQGDRDQGVGGSPGHPAEGNHDDR